MIVSVHTSIYCKMASHPLLILLLCVGNDGFLYFWPLIVISTLGYGIASIPDARYLRPDHDYPYFIYHIHQELSLYLFQGTLFGLSFSLGPYSLLLNFQGLLILSG